ncbi:MAG: hypothetical protein ACYC46_03935 [Acidobacteriaceae bacterium]
MKKILLFFCLLFAATALHADAFDHVDYYRKLPVTKQADEAKTQKIEGDIVVDTQTKALIFQSKKQTDLTIPFTEIEHIVYERTSKPHYTAGLLVAWPLLFTKEKQHFLTVNYKDGSERKYALFRLSKKNVMDILTDIQTATGQTIERHEEK